jgi:membrane protease YdiL (CAAX protease family)
MQAAALRIPIRHLLLIILAQVLALFTQAWLSQALLAQGYGELDALYLAYLAVPPILLITLAPVLLRHRAFLLRLFSMHRISVRLALAAVVLGIVARIAWWAQMTARVSLGIAVNEDPQAIAGPAFSWACPPLPSLMLGFLVMAVVIPIIEETLHRGVLQSAFVHKGPLPAILISALVFTVFHPPASYWFVFFMGIVLGVQFWVTGSLWLTMITHATFNGLIQFDWRCLQGQWNPPPESLPQIVPAAISLAVLAGALVLIAALLRCQWAGTRTAPATTDTTTRSPPAR